MCTHVCANHALTPIPHAFLILVVSSLSFQDLTRHFLLIYLKILRRQFTKMTKSWPLEYSACAKCVEREDITCVHACVCAYTWF